MSLTEHAFELVCKFSGTDCISKMYVSIMLSSKVSKMKYCNIGD